MVKYLNSINGDGTKAIKQQKNHAKNQKYFSLDSLYIKNLLITNIIILFKENAYIGHIAN